MGDIGYWILAALAIYAFFSLGKLKPDPEEAERRRAEFEANKLLETYGPISPQYICPHCQTKGHVRTMPVKRKKGVSGAKVTGALLTFGVSMLATGLSRKEGLTQAHCENCGSTWDF